ncbi:MAG: four-carbon acid sugar kinase family protein [Chloroflexi bacterium]|nr:four-carbon acid sugar kinase family protein [Chloroflexota bacterium]
MTSDRRLLLTFYGDDFTGSTDVMEVLEWAGIPALLFLEPPSPDVLERQFPNVRAVGVAGVSRSMSPSQMDHELPPIFSALKALDAPIFHYKVCSTFDSSPTVGSIGQAIETGLRIFGEQTVPLIIGAPFLRRYVAFSNLFARVDDTTYRLDRHPTMSRHPVTPMTEADLRLHLGEQTTRRIAAMNVLHLGMPYAERRAYYDRLEDNGAQIVVFDTIDDEHLAAIGCLLFELSSGHDGSRPLFLVGSSGIEKAITLERAFGGSGESSAPSSVASVDQLVVVSGSAAPATADQLRWAEANGYAMIRLNAAQLVDRESADREREASVAQAVSLIGSGASVVLYSALGPDDPHISETKAHLARMSVDPQSVGQRLGTQQGMILRAILERTGLRRAIVTGGDTCGYSARQLGIYALSAVMPVAPGAPLCRAYSGDPAFDGLEISLKAGQVGKPDYFGSIRQGFV